MLAALLALALVGQTAAFVAYLHARDVRDRTERRELCDRWQHPEAPLALVGEDPLPKAYLSEDEEDQVWLEHNLAAAEGPR